MTHMGKRTVWMKQGTDSRTVGGQTTRSWISRDRTRSKVVVKRGAQPQVVVSYLVDGIPATPQHRRPDVGPLGPVESTGTWPPAERLARLDAILGAGVGAQRERGRLHAMLAADAKAEARELRAQAANASASPAPQRPSRQRPLPR
jgi:hypothetical protein